MKIKTHVYLQELREAERRGYNKGFRDASERWKAEDESIRTSDADFRHKREIKEKLDDVEKRLNQIEFIMQNTGGNE